MQIHYAQPIHQMKDRLFSFIIIKEHEINKEGGLYHKQEEKLVHHVVCELFVSASITMIVPFLSLYIESLDSSYSNEFVQRWSGYVFGVTFLTAFLISPIWGRIGDRHGYKKILLINGIGIATSILLMGLVQTVYQLFALRLFMGLVTGFISTSMALISAQTEKATAGKTLGTMQMSNVAGGLFGPLMGGFMADSVGFIYTFFLTAAVIYVSAIVIIFGVKEQPIRSKEAKRVSYSRKDVLVHIFKQPLLVVTMLLTFITQVGNFSIQPLLALYIHDLHGPVNLAFYAGLAFSATGLGNLLFTRKWGDLGDRIGHDKGLACPSHPLLHFIYPASDGRFLRDVSDLPFLIRDGTRRHHSLYDGLYSHQSAGLYARGSAWLQCQLPLSWKCRRTRHRWHCGESLRNSSCLLCYRRHFPFRGIIFMGGPLTIKDKREECLIHHQILFSSV